MLRGAAAARRVRQTTKSRRGAGGLREARRFFLGDGEEAIVRFVGRFESDYDISEYLEFDDEGIPDLDGLDEDDLLELCTTLGCFGISEDSDEEGLKGAITRRATKELEPVIQVKHYLSRNKGKNPGPWLQCGDPNAAVEALSWKFDTDCRACFERMNGDKGVGAQILYTWSVYDTRKDHKVESGGRRRNRRDDKDKKNDYETCTMDLKGRCQHCSHNKRIDSRPQSEIPLEELKKLQEEGYSRIYTGGMKYFELPETSYSQVEDLELQARAMCRSCSDGKIGVCGAICPSCHEEFDFDDLVADGWDPDERERARVRCGACGAQVQPSCVYECDECDDPMPARLSDVPVRVRMTLEGKNDKRVFTFTIHGPPEPLELGADPDMDLMLRSKLPDYDTAFAPPSVQEQIKALGCGTDPITGEDVEDDVPSAPTVGKAGRLASRGAKGSKGGKSKGGKSKGVKSGVKRSSGFLRRG